MKRFALPCIAAAAESRRSAASADACGCLNVQFPFRDHAGQAKFEPAKRGGLVRKMLMLDFYTLLGHQMLGGNTLC